MNEIAALMKLLQPLATQPGTVLLIALLLLAAWTDWRSLRIPNWITAPGLLAGLACSAWAAPDAGTGLLLGLGGAATGLLLLMPGYLLRVTGAGDVKLLAMAGAFLGPFATLKATLLVFIVGGVMALAWTAWRRSLPLLLRNTQTIALSAVLPGVPLWRPGAGHATAGRLPYGISISLGTITFVVLRQLGLA